MDRRNMRWVLLVLVGHGITAHAASLTWDGGVAGGWQSAGGGWLNGGTPATWNNTTPDAANFSGTAPYAVDISGGVTVGNLTLSSDGYTFGGSGTLTLQSGVIQVDEGLTAIVSNAVAGTAGLTKAGAGTLVLTNNNKSYTGTTTINGGAIRLGAAAANSLGSSSSGNLTLNGGRLETWFGANQTLNYALSVDASGGELRNLGTDSQRATLAAAKVTGSGALTVSFGTTDTRIVLNSQSGFGGKWIVDGGGIYSANRFLDIQKGASLGTATGDDALTLQNGGRILHRGGSLGGATQGLTLGTGTNRVSIAGGETVTIAAKLSGAAGNGLEIDLSNATSTGLLTHTGNSFLGDLTLSGPGFVVLGAAGVLPDQGGTVTVQTNVTLDLNGYSELIGGLSGMGTVNVRVASASVSLGVGGNQRDATFSGTLTNVASGSSLQVVKVGTGTWTVAGTGIGHAGGTIISNGAIEISAAGAGRLGATSGSAVTLQGGTLQGNFTANTTVGNTITVGASGGTLRNIGNDISGRWTLSANQLYGSGILTLAFGSQNTRFVMADAQNNFTGKWVVNSGGNVNRFVDLNYASGNGFGAATGDDAITLQNDGAVLIRNGLALGSASQGITLGAGRAKIACASTSTGTVAGKLSGPAASAVQFYLDSADSVLIVSNTANSWAGPMQINAGAAFGTLRLGNAGVIPDAGTALDITATARLDLNGYDETVGGLGGSGRVDNMAASSSATLSVGGNHASASFSGFMTNSGAGASLALAKVGNGTQTLSTANGYAGLTTVGAGALRVGHAGALGSPAAGTVVSSGAALELQGGFTLANESLALSGTGLGGSGALRNISGNNTWQGAVQLNNSAALTIASDSGDLKLKGTITQTGGIPPTFQGNGNIFLDGGMNGGFTRGSGAGDVVISKGFTVTGNVTIAAGAVGALKLEGALEGDVSMSAGQLTGTGTVQDVTVANGMISPNANGVGRYVMDSLILAGGAYQWTITNATGPAGVNWDLLTVGGGAGVVDLSGAGSGSITVRVYNAQSVLPNFDYLAAGSWMIVDAGSVAGFSAAQFTVNDSAFTPGSEGGTWSVSQSDGDLYLNYAPGTPVDLSVSLTDSPDPAPVGDTITYSITVQNHSALAIATYTVTGRLASGSVYLGSSDGGTHSGGVVSWTLTNLGAMGSRTVTLTANSGVQGAIPLVAETWPRRPESNSANNRSTNTTTVYCPSAGVVGNTAPASRVATNGHALSFYVSASNADCNAPFLYAAGLPVGATFTTTTNAYPGLFMNRADARFFWAGRHRW